MLPYLIWCVLQLFVLICLRFGLILLFCKTVHVYAVCCQWHLLFNVFICIVRANEELILVWSNFLKWYSVSIGLIIEIHPELYQILPHFQDDGRNPGWLPFSINTCYNSVITLKKEKYLKSQLLHYIFCASCIHVFTILCLKFILALK